MINTDSPLGWAFFALVVLVLAFVGAWIASDKPLRTFVRDSFNHTGGYLAKLWRFWGPRVTDKNFLGAVAAFTTVVVSASFAPREAQIILHGLSVLAALLVTLWENQPFEDLEGPRPQPTIEISGPVNVRST